MLARTKLRKLLLMDILVPIWEGKQSTEDPPIPPGEIVSQPQRIYIPIRGKLLHVPPYMSAVLTHPNGTRKVYSIGDHFLDLSIGNYTVQYVLARKQTTTLPVFHGISQDGWGVGLQLKIYWKVSRPRLVVDTQDFLQTLISTCQAAITDFIRSMPHDLLYQVPGEPQTVSEKEITDAIQTDLEHRKIFDGLEILDLILIDRLGDQRRTDVIQNAIVESKEIETEISLQEQKTHLASKKLEQDLDLTRQRRDLEISQAETSRLVAEEIERKRLRMAEIDAREAELHRSVRQQEIDFKRIEKAQQLEFEEEIKTLEVKGEVLKQIGRAFVDVLMLPDGALGSNGNSRSDIKEVMNLIIRSLQRESPQLSTGFEEPNSHNQVEADIIETLKSIQGLSLNAFDLGPNGNPSAIFLYKSNQINVDWDGPYPQRPPSISIVGGNTRRQIVDVEWDAEKRLVDIFQRVVKTINTTIQKSRVAPGSGTTTWEQPNS